jgi:hypothetical protein
MILNISPGPWTWEYNPRWETAIVNGADGDPVAEVRGNLGYDVLPEDNARLIAAAPDMIEALIDVYGTVYLDDNNRLNTLIANVLEKATGKTWEELTK